MIKQKDLIRHSGVIEYFEDRIQYYEITANINAQNLNYVGYNLYKNVAKELQHILEHFKEQIGDEE